MVFDTSGSYDAAFVIGLSPLCAPGVFADTTLSPAAVVSGYGPVTMKATFIGAEPIAYQWQFVSTSGVTNTIAGATNTTYTLPVATFADAGTYCLLASNACSSPTNVSSTPVLLTVRSAYNLAWRGYATTPAWDATSQNWYNSDAGLDYAAYAQGDNVLFDDNATSFAPTLAGVVTPGKMTVSTASNYNFTGAGKISGSTGLTKDGPGALILQTTNDYTWATVISNGVVQVGNANATGTLGSGPVTNHGVLAYSRTDAVTNSSTISGSGSLSMMGSGALTLTATNSFSGGVLQTNGVINANANQALGNGTTTLSGGVKRVVVADGVTLTNSFTLSPGTGSGSTGRGLLEGPAIAGTGNVTGPIYITAGPGSSGSGPAAGGHFAGGDGNTTGGLVLSGAIVVDASTTWPFSRAGKVTVVPHAGSSYAVWQNEANLVLGGHNALLTTATLYENPGASPSLDLNGYNQTLAGIYGVGPVVNSGASSVTLTLTTGSTNAFSGVISDSGTNKIDLVVTGGSNTLTGANAYTGNTTVSGGTLAISQATLASNSTVTVASGAFLQLGFMTTNRVGGLVLAGVTQPPGVYNGGNTPRLAGTGSLLVASPIATNPTNLTFTVTGGSLDLSWPADHLGWFLQAQTNALTVGISNNWVDVPGSSGMTATNIPISPAAPAAFFRLRSP
jgi:autotransporter-associated beta strand protein